MSESPIGNTEHWQKKLLPVMIRTIVLLSSFFFLASLAQLIYLNYIISHRPFFDTHEALSNLKPLTDTTHAQVLETARMKALIMLEAGSLDDQYHQANVLLMGRLWTSYIGFVTGMILAIVGATFILGKLKESTSELAAKTGNVDFSFKSASPGLILAVLGSILMVTTIVTHHDIDVKHSAIYIHDGATSNSDIPPPLPPPLPPPKPRVKDSTLKVP